MQPDLSLLLELLENRIDSIRLRLSICNQSDARLVLPDPDIDGLRFVDTSTMEASKWGAMALWEGPWGLTIEPRETKQFDYHLPPVHLVPGDWEGEPAKWDGKTFGDEFDVIELPSGNYLVWYQMEVGQDYFCCHSGYRLRDFQREAAALQAVAWTGECKSNRLHLSRV
jgi:hypothetical protein